MTPLGLAKDLLLTYKGIRFYDNFLKKSCYFSKEEMDAYQFQKLRFLLTESYEGVEYYRELFKKIGFQPEKDFQKLTDLQQIPTLSKATAREVRPFLDNPKYLKNAMKLRTSGSTGQPFEINVSENAWIVEQGVVWRHWKWSGYNFRDRMAIVRSYVPKGDAWFKWNRMNNFIYFSPFQLNDSNISKYLNQMMKMNVTILRGYPSSVATIADYVKRTNHPIPKFKFILVASEVLTDTDRFLIEKTLKAPVTNHYGLADVCVMMGDCEKHEGLHNYDEYSYLELMDTDNMNEKRIVGTHLHNLATPLIRYETGDIAELADKPCSCGKTLPTIKNIGGRKDVKLRTPEGYEVPTVNFYTMFETFQDVSRWQIVQHRLDFIEFIVKTPYLAPERIEQLRHAIYDRLPKSIEVDISINKDFVQKGEGKINTVMSFLK